MERRDYLFYPCANLMGSNNVSENDEYDTYPLRTVNKVISLLFHCYLIRISWTKASAYLTPIRLPL